MFNSEVHKVVIIGGGFGSVRTALKLANDKRFEVKLISDQTYFEYHAALYRSATGRSPLEVAIPLVDFFKSVRNVEVVHAKITSIKKSKKLVEDSEGSHWPYDYLVVAVGSVTEYFGIEGLKQYSYGMKSINEALELKHHMHQLLIEGHEEQDYVVVGAGATGVELAAELVNYINQVRKYHKINRKYKIHLIEAADKVLPALPYRFTRKIEKRLKKLGVKLHLNTKILGQTPEGVELQSGVLKSRTVIWTAGMTSNPLVRKSKLFTLSKNKRVVVDNHLNAYSSVFVIGDCAETKYSGMAQTALHDATYVAKQLKRVLSAKPPKDYQDKKPIYAIPVGKRWSAVLWGKVKIYGYPGWVMRRLADLRLYLKFLPLKKALTVWRYGISLQEDCEICKGKNRLY